PLDRHQHRARQPPGSRPQPIPHRVSHTLLLAATTEARLWRARRSSSKKGSLASRAQGRGVLEGYRQAAWGSVAAATMPPPTPPWTSPSPRCPRDTTAAPGVPLGAPPKDAMVLGMQPPLEVGGGDGAADATAALRPSVASTDTDAAAARRAFRI